MPIGPVPAERAVAPAARARATAERAGVPAERAWIVPPVQTTVRAVRTLPTKAAPKQVEVVRAPAQILPTGDSALEPERRRSDSRDRATEQAMMTFLRSAPRVMVAVVFAGVLGGVAGACAHPSPPVGLADCYQSLPIAEAALNLPRTSYQFHGVILVHPRNMQKIVRQRAHKNLPVPSVAPGKSVCAFAFTGNFAAGQVAGAPTNDAGKAAIVLVTTDHKLLFSFVLAKLPEDFSRPFTGA
ncbi:MAG TPA: hypothetical protein VMF65_02435 [Acidimicrobiales bacterium]|nr:hypothetical protein [Acidimicrobiales bacterium]